MEFHQLRYFVAAADELRISKAAERVHVSQPALSRRIRLLEEQIGLRLFDRIKQRTGATPPPPGPRFARNSRSMPTPSICSAGKTSPPQSRRDRMRGGASVRASAGTATGQSGKADGSKPCQPPVNAPYSQEQVVLEPSTLKHDTSTERLHHIWQHSIDRTTRAIAARLLPLKHHQLTGSYPKPTFEEECYQLDLWERFRRLEEIDYRTGEAIHSALAEWEKRQED